MAERGGNVLRGLYLKIHPRQKVSNRSNNHGILITYDISYVMPHISKRKIDKKNFERLIEEFIRSLERSFKQNKTKKVLFEFLTYTERTMLAKRLAVIAMLSKGVSTYAIADVLKMSPSTIDRMFLKYNKGKYKELIKHALGKKDIWEIINSILTGGGIMPPKVGGKRWRHLDKMIYDEKLLET